MKSAEDAVIHGDGECGGMESTLDSGILHTEHRETEREREKCCSGDVLCSSVCVVLLVLFLFGG